MKYAHYDEQTGEVKGFYADDVHDMIPTPHIELTEETWQAACGKPSRVVNGVLEEIPPAQPTYADLRASEYPSFADQFDLLYHGGYDAWRTKIQEVKDKYPKPE